jgi:hypothetical protein
MAAPSTSDLNVKVIEVVLRAIDFRVTIVTLLLGACGVAFGRMWQAGEKLPPMTAFLRIGPAVVGSGIVLWRLGIMQKNALTALTRQEDMSFASTWVNHASCFDAGIALVFLLFCLGLSSKR